MPARAGRVEHLAHRLGVPPINIGHRQRHELSGNSIEDWPQVSGSPNCLSDGFVPRRRRGYQRRKGNQRQQLHARGMPGVAVDRSPRMPGQRRAGQDQPAGAQPRTVITSRRRGRSRRAHCRPSAAPNTRSAHHSGDHRPGRQHRRRRPGPGCPRSGSGVVAGVDGARPPRHQGQQRQQRQPAGQAGAIQRVGRKGQRDGARRSRGHHPALLPAVDGHRGRAESRSLVRATQPGLMLSGTTRTRDAVRMPVRAPRGGPGPMPRWRPAYGCGRGRFGCERSGQLRAVDDELRPGTDQQLLLTGRQRDRLPVAGWAVTGAPSSSAPTVVWIEVCTNRPAIAMTGPCAQSTLIVAARLRAASAGAIGLPSAPSTAISASPGGLSWSKPSAVRSITSSQSSRLTVTVSVTRDFSGRLWLRTVHSRTCGPSPRSTATMVGCAGTDDRWAPAVARSPRLAGAR